MTQIAMAALLCCTPMLHGQFLTTPREQQVCKVKFTACASKYTDTRDIITCVRRAGDAHLVIIRGR